MSDIQVQPQFYSAETLPSVVPDAPEPPVPQPNLHYMSRRPFAKAAFIGGILAHGLAVRSSLDFLQDVEATVWPTTKPSVTFLHNEQYTDQTEVAFFMPGFGDLDGAEQAFDWKTSGELPPNLLTGYVDYSTQAASIDTITGLIRDSVDMDKIEAVNFFGNSMGGLYAIAVAAKLRVPVRSLMLCSSPSSFDNAYFGNLSAWVAKMPVSSAVAVPTKFVASAYRTHQLHPDMEVGEVAESALRRTLGGAHPESLQRQLQIGRSVDIQDSSLIGDLQEVFIPDFSRVSYARSERDTVVAVRASGNAFKTLFHEKLGVDFELFNVQYDGHADVEKTVTDAAAGAWIRSSVGTPYET